MLGSQNKAAMAVDIDNGGKDVGDVEHRQHSDEKSSDSDVADPNEITWTEAEEKQVRNKVSSTSTNTGVGHDRSENNLLTTGRSTG